MALLFLPVLCGSVSMASAPHTDGGNNWPVDHVKEDETSQMLQKLVFNGVPLLCAGLSVINVFNL